MPYQQLSREERYQIKVFLKTGQNQSQIAAAIGVDKSTISRELVHNRGQRGYRPAQNNDLAKEKMIGTLFSPTGSRLRVFSDSLIFQMRLS